MTPRLFRVGFDMDGVLADLGSALSRDALKLFGAAAATPENPLTRRRRRRLWEHVQSTRNFWESLEENDPGGVSRLASLARQRRWEVVFLTTRPETAGDSAQTQTHRWLTARGFACPNVFVVRRSRGAVAAIFDLDVVVDDRPEHCLDVIAESQARAVLMWRRTTDAPELVFKRARIDIVGTVGGALDRVAGIDDERRRRPPSLISSVLRRFAAASLV